MNANININEVILETPRLILRAWQKEDLDDFYEYAKVDGVGEMAGWIHHASKEETAKILDMFIRDRKVLAIVCKENNKVIGSIGIEKYNETVVDESFNDLSCRELGYVLNKEYWGKGYMSEAVCEVIRYCFEDLCLDALFCGYFERNARSKRVNDKVGFTFYKDITFETMYGTLENTKLNVLYRDAYEKSKKIRIRRAEETDMDDINDLLYQVLMVHHHGRPDLFKADTKKYTDEELKEIIHDDARPIFVAVHNEKVVGYAFCIFQQYLNHNTLTDVKTLYIDDLCVDENCRGLHIGKQLYEYVLSYAKQEDCYNVTLNVWSCNESAMKFYEKCGLTPQKVGMEQIL